MAVLVVAVLVVALMPAGVVINRDGFLSLSSNIVLATEGEEVIELRDQYSKTVVGSNGNLIMTSYLGSIHYEETAGNFQPIDTTIVPSDRSNWDWEVETGQWQLFINNDGTTLVKKGDHWLGHRLHGVAYLDITTKDWSMLPITNAVTPAVEGNTITWENILYGTDLVISYTNDQLKEDIIFSQALRDKLATAGWRPSDFGYEAVNTYLVPVFEVDWSESLPMKLKGGATVNPDEYETEEAIYFESSTPDTYFDTNLVAFLPVDYAISANPINPSDPEGEWEYASEKIRKRLVLKNDKHWLLAGVPVLALNQMPEGSIIFDPTETLRPSGVGNSTEIANQLGAGEHWELVDEVAPDAYTTCLYDNSTSYVTDTYVIADNSAPGGTSVVSVTINAHCRCHLPGSKLKLACRTHNTDYFSPEESMDGTWTTYDWEMTDNPDTSSSWTWDEVDAMEAGLSLKYTTSGDYSYCTQVYVEVEYATLPDISNTPSSKDFGAVGEDASYWSTGSTPTFPLDDTECYFTVTNNGDACNITIKATNFTGGDGWVLTSGNPESGTVRMKAGKSGDANEEAMVILTTDEQSFISGLAGSATKKWELLLQTGTFTDGISKESIVTLTATLS